MAGQGDLTESATENKPPMALQFILGRTGKGETVR